MDAKTGTSIVVGLDRSRTGDHALQEAMKLAARLPDSELHICHVIETSPNLHDARELDELGSALPSTLHEVREHVRQLCAPAFGSPAFTQELAFHIRLGDPAEALHQLAVDVDADLIIVGTHGRRGMARMIDGSVAEKLVRTARVSVLVVHPKELAGLKHSDRLEPAHPRDRPLVAGGGLSVRSRLEFRPRVTRISGLL